MSHAARWMRPRVFAILLLALIASVFAAASPAHASHLKGASLDAQIDASGQLTGTVSLIKANYGDCTSPSGELGTVTYTAPGESATTISIASQDEVISACTPGSITTTGTFSVSVAGKADGDFLVSMVSSARVGGIQNSAPSTITVRGSLKKEAGFTHRTPKITSQPALGISTQAGYAQQLAMTTESGAAPTVALLQSSDNGQPTYDSTAPATNLVSVTSGGLVEIPFSTTSGLTVGHYYVYKVRITDDRGQYTERDLLMTVSNNSPPVFSGDSASGVVDIRPNTPTTLNFAASDPDSGQTLTMAVGGVPSWGSSTTGTGTATVSLNAPESAVGTTVQIAVDATDSDVSAPMTAARTVTVRVVAAPAETPAPTPTAPAPTTAPVVVPAAPKLTGAPPAVTASRDAELTWTGEAGGSFTCTVNNRPPAPCSSPLRLSGLTPGRHTVRVYQSNAAGAGAVLEFSWTVTEARLDVGAKLAVKSDDLTVGCKVQGVTIARCVVDVFADVPAGTGKKARAAKKTKIGTGQLKTDKTTNALDIELTLNATGKRLVNRLGGVKVSLDMTAWPQGGGAKLTAKGASRLLPSSVKVTPATGIFRYRSAKLTPRARAWVKTTAKGIGPAVGVRCTGHTSRSGHGLPEANRRLGLRRAKAICAALRQAGVKVTTSARTAGETQPRSSNRTAAGRERNRRVELRVAYRR